jgi:hypothetical protein
MNLPSRKVDEIEEAFVNAVNKFVSWSNTTSLVRTKTQMENHANMMMHRLTRDKHKLIKSKYREGSVGSEER